MPASRASARLAAVLTLLLALAVIHVSAPAEAAGPLVRVPGTETWHPTLEVALDEVALLWKGDAKRTATPTLVPGTTMLRLGRDAAAMRVTGASTLTDLVTQARALRDANPDWDARLVLYTPGIKRSARTRRLLTDEIVVQRADGGAATEHVADPLDTLEIARALAARPDVTTAEPIALAPDYLRQRLARKLAKLQRQDKASERQEFFALKRLPPGERRLPVERYFDAREAMKHMPLRSTAAGGIGFPSLSELRMSAHTAAAFLGSWTPLGPGNVGGRTRALVVDPIDASVLYAGGVAGGVWKTTDGGDHWTPLTDTLLPNLAIASLDIDPTNSAVLYAGTGEGVFNGDAVRGAGIFKTADGGSTWTQLIATATDDFNFVDKVKVLGNGSTVLAATRTGLWRSQDSGITWGRLIDAKAVSGCLDIVAGDSYVLASCGTFAQGTVYRSASPVAADAFPFTAVLGSGGKLDTAMGRTSLAIAPSNPAIVYALATSIAGGTYNQGLRAVYKSTDGGITWQTTVTNTSAKRLNTLLLTNPIYATSCFQGDSIEFFNQGWYDNVIAVDPVDPNRVWAGGIDLFRSDNGGVDWGLTSFWWTDSDPPGAFAHADQHTIVFDPGYNGTTNQTMFIGNDGGVFKTTTARGTTTTNACDPDIPPALAGRWIELNNGYGVTQFYHGLPFGGPDGGNTFFGGTQDNGTVLGTVAAGIDGWTTINGGDGGYVAVDPTNPSVLYSEGTDLSIAKSTDGGATFNDATLGIGNSGFLFIVPFVMSPNNPQTLWTGGAQMWRTTNAAGSWTAASAPLGCGSVSAIAVAPRAGQADDSAVDQVVLAGTSGGCVFRTRTALSATGGTPWTRITTVGSGYVSWITFDPTNANNVYLTHSTFGSVHVERSVDGGLTFSALDGTSSPLPDVPVHTIVVAPGNPSHLYIGTDVGVFSSDDAGDTWSVENTGFANVITEALAVGQVGGVDHVFAFTHGRGVFRVALPASTADIAVVQVSVPSATPVLAGRTLAVTETVANVGTVPASASFTVGYALVPVNPAGTPTGPDIALTESRAVSVLSGQASSQATTPLAMPNVPAGSYKIRVIADAAGQVTEDPVPQNNSRLSNAFTIVRPDLMVVSVTPASTAAAGGPLNVTHVLRNLAPSPAHAPSTTSTFHLATNRSMSTVIGVLGDTPAPPVMAGATTLPIPGLANVVPIGTPPGRYFVIVQANSTGTFEEITTANNFMAASTPVLVGADLLVTAAGATPAGVIPGGNLSVTFTAKNQGGAAATFDVGFDLVPVTATGVPTGGGDVPLGTYGQVIPLDAGQTSARTKIIALSPSLPIGTYKLRVTADPGNAVGEADETNNSFLVPAIITVAKPDLIVQSVTFAPIATATNGSVTVTHVVKNRGAAPGHAPASTSRLFLNSVNNSLTGAFDLGTVAVGAVTAGATQTASRIVAMPPGITPGLYFALAIADDAGVVTESDESNNRGASLTRLIVGPDLVVSAAATSTGTSPGSTLPITHTIANRGGNAAGPFTVAFSLVPVTPAGVPTGAPEVPVGPARSGVTVLANSAGASSVSGVLIPADVNPGTYRVKITADAGNVVVEADEANNTRQTGILTIARGNLAVQSVTFTPPASRENGSVTVTHVLRNLASPPATVVPTISSLFLSATGNSSGLLFLGNVSAPQIVGGGTASLVKPVTIPLGTPPGLYFVVARADAGATVIEGDENNTLASLTRLIVGPDLTLSAATAGAGVASGMNLSVSYTVRNAGGAAATSFDVAFFLVPVTAAGVPTGGPEVEVGPRRQVLSLAAGAMQAFTNSVLIPADTVAGTFKIRVSVDAGGTVAEASESNNELLTGLVRVARPDLTVPSVTFTPAAVTSGGTVNVTHVVKNVTLLNGNAPASQSAIYLSQNASFEGALGPALALVPVPPLASSGMATLLRAVDVGSLSTGRYFFVVRADDPGALIEQDENNNTGISVTALIVGPDAAVTAATTAATGAGPGTNVSVSYTLKNLGVVATGTFDVAFDVTPVTAGGAPNGAPVPLGTVRSGVSLLAGQTATFVNNALLPSDLAPGPYRIGVTLVGFAAPDADPTNDTRLSNTVTVVRPDLVMSVFTPPTALVVGRTIGITNTVKNNATASGAAGPFGVGVYLSSTGSSDTTGDTLVGNRSLTGLVGGGTSAVPVTITAPSTTGNFFLKAFADFTSVVVEANESNNVTVKPVAVVPDLTAGRTTGVVASINFNISGRPTCTRIINGSGMALESITTQTGNIFSGGKITFSDSGAGAGPGNDTVTFSGTVTSAGAVTGTFAVNRVGGGGGSGSGKFTGAAGVGSPAPLTLNLTGSFSAGELGTCDLTALIIFGSGSLTNPSVVPASLVAGEYSNVMVCLGTSTPWPANGLLLVTFPAGFEIVGASLVTASGPNGSYFTSTSGQTLTLTRLGDGSTFTGNASLIFAGSFGGVRNPGVSGSTGTFSVRTTTADGSIVFDSGTAPPVTITPGALLNASVTPASLVADVVGNVTLEFTSSNLWPGDGTLHVDFPTGFDVSSAGLLGSSSGPNGTFSLAVSGQTVTLTRIGGGDPFVGSASIPLNGIRNPATGGATGTFSFTTATAGGTAIDSGTAPGVILTP